MQGSLDPEVQTGDSIAGHHSERLGGRRSDPCRWAIACLLAGGVLLGWPIVAFFIRLSTPRTRQRAAGQRWTRRAFRFLGGRLDRLGVLKIDVQDLAIIDREQRPLLLVPNHPSILDAPIVVSQLPNVCCIMKQALLSSAFTGSGARLAGYVDNGSLTGMVRRAIEALHGGSHLLVFPEATRTVSPPVGQFTRAYALIAHKSRVPMQTLLIETDSPYGTKGWPLWRRPATLPIRVAVRRGRRFAPGADIDRVVAEMQAYFEGELGARSDR